MYKKHVSPDTDLCKYKQKEKKQHDGGQQPTRKSRGKKRVNIMEMKSEIILTPDIVIQLFMSPTNYYFLSLLHNIKLVNIMTARKVDVLLI
jgi:hypothetical protein